jgi:uncharacterized protein (DUF488 family)
VKILTVGHGNRDIGAFVDLVKRHGVTHLVDVRSLPDARLGEEYRRPRLAAEFATEGLGYVSMSDTLSGIPNSSSLCKAPEAVNIQPLFHDPKFRLGLATLKKAAEVEGRVICLMCECVVPHRCHRSRLIGTALAGEEVEVLHIDDRGMAVRHEQIVDETTFTVNALHDVKRAIAYAHT